MSHIEAMKQIQQCLKDKMYAHAEMYLAEAIARAEGTLEADKQEPVECQYGKGGYACCEGGPCKADEQNNALFNQEQGKPVAWRNAAIRVGEDLCSVGPHGYYEMNAEQWLDWALSVVTVHLPPQQRTWVGLTDEQTQKVLDCAKRLVEHADFKLGGILSADSKAKDIPSNAVSSVKARHLASLRDALVAHGIKGEA